MAERSAAIAGFLQRAGWGDAARRPLAADASFRKYERLSGPRGRAVLMDAPPPQENVRPFLKVARHLSALGYSAPRILAEDATAGLLLLEDLGDGTFTRLLAGGANETDLYRLAVDLLIDLHRRPEVTSIDLPPYDDERLLLEVSLLTDWYMPAIGRPVSSGVRDDYLASWREVSAIFHGKQATLVLRDYHVDNLMRLPERAGVAACGLLDFQDALIGPAAYDLVSLLEDARRDIAPPLVKAMLDRYVKAFPSMNKDEFQAAYSVLGAQRSAKILGIFTRLMVRDGKPHYLGHIPRVWRLLETGLQQPALKAVRPWFDQHLPRGVRAVPATRVPA
jgi:aminoglycoside/choline kinase family phosphotransferase